MTKLKIKEAITFAKQNGNKVTRTQIALAIFPEKTERQAKESLYRIESGKSKSKYPEIVDKVCELTGVDANFLFGK